MTQQLTRALAWMLRRSAGALPAGQREWGEAVWAEAGQVPAGWSRWCWLAGGLRLVAREAQVTRRIGYGLGAVPVAAVVAWAAWLSWQRALPGDADRLVDRARVIELAAVLAVLPWVSRRRGVFGGVACSLLVGLIKVAADLPAQPGGLGGLAIAMNLAHLGIVMPVLLLVTGAVALMAARRTPATGSDGIRQIRASGPGEPDRVRTPEWPRVRQGLGAGMAAGTIAGLMITILVGWWPVLFWSPLSAVIGALPGAVVGAQLAPPESRLNGSWMGGVFAASLRKPGHTPAGG